MNIFKKNLAVAGVIATSALVSTGTFAAVQAQAVTDWQDEMIGDITLVGGALLAAAFAAVIFKWVKAAIFG